MSWKAPYRPRNEISQTFNDGLVILCHVTDTAAPGRLPEEKLSRYLMLPYEEQRLGIQRYYQGKQNQMEIQRVLRTPRAGQVTSQDVAITQDGRQYRVDLVQMVEGVFPPSQDLTLVAIEQVFDVSDLDTSGEEG